MLEPAHHRSVPFFLVDVFAERPLTGNPLAVVPDADDLALPEMRALAREFNQSETTFLVRPTGERAVVGLRSFTPTGEEVGGAGHNALGAWIWLVEAGRVQVTGEPVHQELGGGVLPVRLATGASGRVSVAMSQRAPQFGTPVAAREALAGSLGVDDDAMGGAPARSVDTGVGHLMVELRDRDVVDHVRPDPDRLSPHLHAAGAQGCYVYSREGRDGGPAAYARFFNPTKGITEDPATGTAAGPLVAHLVELGVLREGRHSVEQGTSMGRRSLIDVSVHGDSVEVSGTGLVVAEGSIRV